MVFFLDFKSKLADLQDFYIFGSFLFELRKISQSHITVQKRKIKGQIGDNSINHGSWETVFHGYYRFIPNRSLEQFENKLKQMLTQFLMVAIRKLPLQLYLNQ